MASTDASSSGMSVLELLLAVTMMMVFTGVVAACQVSLLYGELVSSRCEWCRCNDESLRPRMLPMVL